jgi:hypothetical protein
LIYLGCTTHATNGSIATVGGTDGVTGVLKHFTEAQAIAAIDAGTEIFAVRDDKGHQADVRVAHNGTRRFLETHRDGVVTDNLGHLPVCRHVQAVAPSPSPAPYRPTPVQRGHCVGVKLLK